jgi:peroxiredoxin
MLFLAMLGCSNGKNAPAAAEADAPPRLHATPVDRLGTMPDGFGLRVGDRAPDAMLVDLTGTTRQLSQLYAAGPVFVVFYRGGWCPFCNLQLHELAAAVPEFDRRRIAIAAISVDVPSEQAKSQARDGVPFAMLSDPELIAHRGFRVVHVADAAQQARLAGLGIDLHGYSGTDHHSFAIPSVFLVDRSATIRFAHVDDDYETRPSARQLLEIADRIAPR